MGAAGEGTAGEGVAGSGAAGDGVAGSGAAGRGGEGGGRCEPCGACFRCGASGACEPDPNSSWKVSCVSAKVNATKPNGQVWDPAYSSPPQSNPDPFCQLETKDGRTRSSPVVMDTLSPTWNADLTPTSGGGLTASLLLGQDQWTVTVLDDDPAVPTTETICTVTPALDATALESGEVMFHDEGSCTQLTLGLACAE